MNNKYKQAMSGIRHSDELVERIFDMTINKKTNKAITLKRIAAGVCALAILVGGGFGVNQLLNNKEQIVYLTAQNELNPLSVMAVYAGEYKSINDIKAGSMNEQNVFYSIHYADINDEKALAQADNLYISDKAKLESNMNTLYDKGASSVLMSGKSTIDSVRGEATIRVYTLIGGLIALDIDDYSDVKKMTISNDGKYGELYFDYVTNSNSCGKQQIGNKISISGQELRESKASKAFECGTTNPVNKGYELNWTVNDELYKAIGNNPKFDLSQINDTIAFVVEYNDGTIKTASLNLHFDSDGYMHFE